MNEKTRDRSDLKLAKKSTYLLKDTHRIIDKKCKKDDKKILTATLQN